METEGAGPRPSLFPAGAETSTTIRGDTSVGNAVISLSGIYSLAQKTKRLR